MNSHGLLNLWNDGGIVIRSVALFLFLMSITSWVIILGKIVDTLRYRRIDERTFWLTDSFEHGLDQLAKSPNNPFHQLALNGLTAVSETPEQVFRTLHGHLNRQQWLARCLKNTVDDLYKKMEAGLNILASIGSTAPFVGLFGTVWGIYHALINMSGGEVSSIHKVSGPIGEALIMTALGLAVAIPAVLAYNTLRRSNAVFLARLQRFTDDLHVYLMHETTLQTHKGDIDG